MNRKYYLATVLLVITLLSACAGPQLKWSDAGKIKAGMTTEEVTQILGEPNAVSSRDGKLYYTWASRRLCQGSRAVTIDFKDNKVTDAPAIPNTFKD
jgi:outer membrane protein assembly factor BamE (lipoprotein component of BamABCDE complex)